MAIPTSAAFKTAQAADVNLVASRAFLVLGNYGNRYSTPATASSSGDFSADYPAAGAIDGDKTFINIGPASGAENNVGRGSWRSSGTPDAGDDVYLEVDFGTPRTFNRTRVYHLNGNGLREYALAYWDGASWIGYVGDVVPIGPGGFGDNPFGDAPFGDPVPPGITPAPTNMKYDSHDHATITAQRVRIWVGKTEVANDKANVVELEFYRVVDISSRIKSVNPSRQRDYKLGYNMAATCSITADNSDRFFSPNYLPTAAEVAAGFVNSELRPNIGLEVYEGFSVGATEEVVRVFTGTLDSLRVRSVAREATLEARDGIKGLIDQVVSSSLKQNLDVGDLVLYLLQLGGVNVNEADVDSTTIVLDRFFTFEESILTSLQKLVQACGDAAFFYTEDGTARFAMYLTTVPQTRTDTTDADFLGYTVFRNAYPSGNSMRGYFGGIFSGSWSIATTPATKQATTGGIMDAQEHGANDTGVGRSYGTWQGRIYPSTGWARWYFIRSQLLYVPPGKPSYYLEVSGTQLTLNRQDLGPVNTVLLTVVRAPAVGDVYKVTRDAANLFTVYVNNVSVGTVTDATYTTAFSASRLEASGTAEFGEQQTWDALGANLLEPFACEIISNTVDQSAAISSEGAFQTNQSLPTGASVNWYTSTSPDGITWEAWAAVVPGDPITSTAQRYLRYKGVLNIPYSSSGSSTPVVYDVTVNWNTGTGGTEKYHSSTDFFIRYDTNLLNLEAEITDTLGGDSAVLNDVSVSSAPLVLTGSAADIQWQGTTNVPAAAISPTNPLAVVAGVYTYPVVVSQGMDIGSMTGANPAAAAITFAGGAAGSWIFSRIHPTKPVLQITVTAPGTITNLTVVGKAYSNTETPYQAAASDTSSIALYGRRALSIANDFIINSGVAALIAARMVLNYRLLVTYLPSMSIRPHFSMQLGDRVNVVDANTGISADYHVAGITHVVSASEAGAEAHTAAVVVKI